MFTSTTAMLALAGSVAAGNILWDGRINSTALLDEWSFSNTVGQYQYYIHGDGATSEYVKLDSTYKNPADSGSLEGFQITIDNTSVWNSDNMLRTELIPQTTAAINTGKVFYHFSMQHTGTNPPSSYEEHQVCFFESHFTEMKYGLMSGEQATLDTSLRWEVNSVSQWNVTFSPLVWHNIAYAVDFDAGTVGFWHSTGADDLTLTVSPVAVTASSNGADWHLGVLRLPSSTGRTDTSAEDWHFSGVYIESGDITTSVSGPGSVAVSSVASVASVASTSSVSSVAKAPATTSTTSEPSTTSTTSIVIPSSSTTVQATSIVQSSTAPQSTALSSAASIAPASSAQSTAAATTIPTTLQTTTKPSSSLEASSLSTLPVTTVPSVSSVTSASPSSTSLVVTSVTASTAQPSATDSDSGCEIRYVYV